MNLRALAGAVAPALLAGAALADDPAPAPEPTKPDAVVAYCIEPMQTMSEKILALIEPQFRCAAGTHLKRDSRPTRVVPTGEEKLGRPFVLRFAPPESANAWFVRGYTAGQ